MNLFITINIYLLSVSGFFLLVVFTLNKIIKKYENDIHNNRVENGELDSDNDNEEEEERRGEQNKKIEIPYEDKYKELFNKLELTNNFETQDKLESLSKCILFENTPLGNVIMFYKFYEHAKDASSFIYYSDHNVPFRILESISQKYCLIFKCKNIYIDMQEELKKYETQMLNDELNIEKEGQEGKEGQEHNDGSIINRNNLKKETITKNKNNVFANFKSYNKIENSKNEFVVNNSNNITTKQSAKPSANAIDNINKLINNAVINNSQVKEENNNKFFLKDRTNRYTYLGKLSNFSVIQKNVKNDIVIKNITYRDYKNNKI